MPALPAPALPRAIRSAAVQTWTLACAVLLPSALTAVAAETPRLQFDVPPVTACRDVTTPEFATSNPDERLIEVQLEVSTLLTAGGEEDLVEYFFRVTSPTQSLIVADYQPKTTLDSQYAGPIAVERKNESQRSVGLSINGAWDHLVHISGSGDRSSKDGSTVRYELQAPHEPVTISGTVQRGRGVYFKIRPARQFALEGARVFDVTFRAPRGWRGDYVQVHCQAAGRARGLVGQRDESVVCGQRDFFVGLYLEGDAEAKALAAELGRAEAALQKVLAGERRHWQAAAGPSILEPLAALWQRNPERHETRARLERLIFQHERDPSGAAAEFADPLRTALTSYLEARAALRSLDGR